MFVYYLKQATVQGINFNHTQFQEDVFQNVERPFTFDKTEFPTEPKGANCKIKSTVEH